MTRTPAEAATFPNHKSVPIVTQDARFRAGKKLKQRGRAHLGTSNIFETLVDRAEEEFGPTSIETAAVYYELGHSLFLEISRNPTSQNSDKIIEDALEYMAKSCSILYNHHVGANNETKNEEESSSEAIIEDSHYQDWAKDQIPRVLLGIGNLQSYQRKHADAIDSYLNSVPFREEASNQFKKEKTESTASLRSHRLLAESYVLISEELLLSPPPSHDLVHGETGLTIVKAEEVTNLAKSYYEQGKEKLQDIVYMMASLEEKGSSEILEAEKQDVCHLATMLVEVGMSLAQRSEEDSNGNESAMKKKRIV